MAVVPIGTGIYRWSLTAIDLKVAGTTGREMVAAAAGKKFIMTGALFIRTALTGSEPNPSISLGVGSAHSGELLAGLNVVDAVGDVHNLLYDGVNDTTRYWTWADVGTNGIWLRVVSASAVTVDVGEVHLFGFYR
jgi:hypothetical protein